MRRTSATGDEVEGTTNVIARIVAFKFSFDDGYGMRFLPIPMSCFCFYSAHSHSPLEARIVKNLTWKNKQTNLG